MNIGAGAVINEEQAIRAVNAGAEFIVSSGFSEKVALYVRKQGIPYYPGCVTPTEIMQALELGITTVKFFPANVFLLINGLPYKKRNNKRFIDGYRVGCVGARVTHFCFR